MLPAPRVPAEPPPHYRSTPPPPEADPDDLTEIKGIGPVYAGRLVEAGIETFEGLGAAEATLVAAAAGVSAEVADLWIERARGRAT